MTRSTEQLTAPKILVISGAGLSAESGLPTFRNDPDGKALWDQESVETVATYHTWKLNFERVHRFYDGLRLRLPEYEPSEAHRMLATWERDFGATLMTQNVDDLLERTGATRVVHLHGELLTLKCEACGHLWRTTEAFLPSGRCPIERCRSHRGVKPGVIFFGETAPAYKQLWTSLASLRTGDFLVVVGTSGQVIPVAEIATTSSATTVLIDPEPFTGASGAFRTVIREKAGPGLAMFDKALRAVF